MILEQKKKELEEIKRQEDLKNNTELSEREKKLKELEEKKKLLD